MDTLANALKFFDLIPGDLPMIAVGAVLFIFFWKIMEVIFFKPHLALLERREAATGGAERDAGSKVKEADEIMSRYEATLLEARISAMKERLEKTDQARKEAAEMIGKAEREASDLVAKLRESLNQQTATVRKDALKEADALVQMVVQKLKTPQAQRQ